MQFQRYSARVYCLWHTLCHEDVFLGSKVNEDRLQLGKIHVSGTSVLPCPVCGTVLISYNHAHGTRSFSLLTVSVAELALTIHCVARGLNPEK